MTYCPPLGNEPFGYGCPLLVTARHNVLNAQRAYGNVWVRINTPEDDSAEVEIDEPWVFPDDPAVDIAVLPFWPPFQFEPLPIPNHWFVTDAVIEEQGIGIGEDLVVLGLFGSHVGTKRNLPIVRSGNIASMPEEALVDENTGHEYSAYLAEVRSIKGLSGSPVFVAVNQYTRLHLEQTPHIGQPFYLLGVIRGHWRQQAEADFGEEVDEPMGVLNTGIAIVTPITEIVPLFEREEIMADRKNWRRARAAESAGEQTQDSLDAETEYERFEELTKTLVNTPKSEIDEKRKEADSQ